MQKSRNNNGSTNKKSIEKNYQKKQQNSKDCNTAKTLVKAVSTGILVI